MTKHIRYWLSAWWTCHRRVREVDECLDELAVIIEDLRQWLQANYTKGEVCHATRGSGADVGNIVSTLIRWHDALVPNDGHKFERAGVGLTARRWWRHKKEGWD